MSETKRPHGSRFRDALVIINPGHRLLEKEASTAAARP